MELKNYFKFEIINFETISNCISKAKANVAEYIINFKQENEHIITSGIAIYNDIPNKPLIYSLAAVYFSYKMFNFLKKVYRAKYAKRLEKTFDKQINEYDGGDYDLMSIDYLKRHFLFKKLIQAKVERSFLTPFHIVEIGYCGSNFEYYPDMSSVTLCNDLQELEPFIKKRLALISRKKYLRLTHENFTIKIDQLNSNSADVVVCTHYLCCIKDQEHVLNQVHRVLKTGGLFVFIEHCPNDYSTSKRITQFLMTPFWKIFNNGCSLNRSIIKSLDKIKFRSLDQTFCSLNLSSRVNGLVESNVYGFAVK